MSDLSHIIPYLNTTNTYHGCSYIQGVRVVMVGAYSVEKLGNRELRKEWVSNMTKKALENHADGINIDIEEPVPKGSKEETLLTMLVNETTRAFHDAIKGSQVSCLEESWGEGYRHRTDFCRLFFHMNAFAYCTAQTRCRTKSLDLWIFLIQETSQTGEQLRREIQTLT